MSWDFFMSSYGSELTQALLVGTLLGAIVGVIALTAEDAGEGVSRVIFGIILGGLLMLGYEVFRIGGILGYNMSIFTVERGSQAAPLLFSAFIHIIQAGLLGGILMLVSLAPLRALIGAAAGVIIGIISALGVWYLLGLIGYSVPLLVFGIAVVAVVWVFLEIMPSGS